MDIPSATMPDVMQEPRNLSGPFATAPSAVIAAAAAAITLLASLRFILRDSLYTDEIAFLLLSGRYFLEHGNVLSLFPQCGNLSRSAPLLWLPTLAPIGLLHRFPVTGFLSVKVAGAVFGTTLFASYLAVVYIVARRGNCAKSFLADGIAPFFLGFFPVTVSLLRPEALIATYGVGASALFLCPAKLDRGMGKTVLSLVILFIVHAAVFGLHPKAVMLLPLGLLATWSSFSDRNCRTLALAVVSAAAGLTFLMHLSLLGGSTCPLVSGTLQQYSHPVRDIISNPLNFPYALIQSLSSGLLVPMQSALDFQLGAATTSADGLKASGGVLTYLTLGVVLMGAAHAVAFCAVTLWRAALGQSVPRHGVICCVLLLSLAAILMTNTTRFFYHATLNLPLMFLAFTLAWQSPLPGFAVVRRAYCTCLIFVAVTSAVLLLSKPELVHQNRHRANFASLSTSETAIDAVESSSSAVKDSCTIFPSRLSARVVLSDAAYLPYRTTREPILLRYIADSLWGRDIQSLPRFLVDQRVEGMVAQCDEVPAILKPFAVQAGKVCCLGKAGLHEALMHTTP